MAGMKSIKTVVVYGNCDTLLFPCGACRQVIQEFADHNTKIVVSNKALEFKEYSMAEILPGAFIKGQLDETKTV